MQESVSVWDSIIFSLKSKITSLQNSLVWSDLANWEAWQRFAVATWEDSENVESQQDFDFHGESRLDMAKGHPDESYIS